MSDDPSRGSDEDVPDRGPFDDESSVDRDRPVTVPDGPIRSGPDVGQVLEGDDGETRRPGLRRVKGPGHAGRRLLGMLALLLGLIGSAFSLVGAFSSVAVGFGASDNAERLVTPIEATVDRLEVRVDQTDDLLGPSGATAGGRAELQARVDGLVDLATAASQALATIEDHFVYGRLPVDTDGLSESLADMEEGARTIEAELDSAGTSGLTAQNAQVMGDQLNTMQSSFSTIQDQTQAVEGSLTNWTRLGSLAGFAFSLWSLWAQTWLARRGWRGLRALEP